MNQNTQPTRLQLARIWALPSLSVIVVTAGAIACFGDTTPHQIVVDVPTLPIFDSAPVDLRARVVNKGGETLKDKALAFSVIPTDIADVDGTGRVRCKKVGDATLSVSGAGLSTNATVKCQPVASVTAPATLRLSEGGDAKDLGARAYDVAGQQVTFAPILSSSNTDSVSISGAEVRGVMLGRALVVAELGGQRAVTDVEVVRKLDAIALMIGDGVSQNWTLGRGKYLVSVDVTTNANSYGVTLKWVGGDGCRDVGERQRFEAECRIPETGSVIIYNPTTFGLGPSAQGNMTLYQIPE